ncbi:hypothetical protein N9D23_09795 [Rubripirellula sp.]|nr:hypothetical protein [Rubripirellula sp.]MDF1843273.1 hypothetical protein [Rubripirellula sp.]
MITTQQLTFLGSPFFVVLSIVAVFATAWLGQHAWRRSGYSKSQAGLELLRLTIVILVAILLNQPEWVQEYRPDSKPTVAVLWDDSESMMTRDAVSSTTSERMTRAEAIAPLLDPAAWDSLRDQLNIVIQPISTQEDQSLNPGTDLHQPLLEASRREQLAGVVLISDGDWNDGRAPVEAASRLRIKNVPIIAVATGSPKRLPDIALSDVQVPSFGAAGKTVRIPFSIESSLPQPYLTTVTLTTSAGDSQTKELQIAPMGRTDEAFIWKMDKTGDYTVTVNVPLHNDETIIDNNEQTAPIVIRQEQLKVLIVESSPRWEYRYLRNALSRDPGVEVSCLLFHPGLEKAGGGSEDYIKVFPEELDQLVTYDVVFLGDVGLNDNQLTNEQCDLLKGLIEVQASGLVLIPGWQGRQFSLLDTSLKELYPVTLDSANQRGWGARTAAQFELTRRGRDSLLTKLADTASTNAQVWEDLPGFQWYAPVVRAKPGTEILAVHQEMSNQYGRIPLLVTRTFGAGKVLFMGTDGAWRWRKGVEDKYHYRFWGQVVRWMAYQRNMAKGETMRLFHTPDQPEIRQTLTLSAHVMDTSGEPVQRGEVVARVVAPSGETDTMRLVAEGEQWGVFQGRFTPAEPGNHAVTVTCKETEKSLQTNIYVQGQDLEQVGIPARPRVLQELALVSGGELVQADEVEEVVKLLAELPQPPPAIRRLQLWSHPLTAALLVSLLAVFWIWRKAAGLI